MEIELRSRINVDTSYEYPTVNIETPVMINADHHDIIPFTFIAESGLPADGSTISFTIQPSDSKYVDYTAIIYRNNQALFSNTASNPNIYIPEIERTKYSHDKKINIDVLAKDANGIRDIRTYVAANGQEFKKIENNGQIYIVPLFTWEI